MCPVRNRLVSRQDAVQDLSRLQVDHVKTHMSAKANVADTVLAIHRVREDPFFADVLDLTDHAIGSRVKDRQGGGRTEIHQLSIQAHYALVSSRSNVDAFD